VTKQVDEKVITEQIRSFIGQKFPLARRRKIHDEDNLLESGVIDSLGVLEIVTFLNEDYSLIVEDDDLTPEHFQSIHSIANFVEQRLQAVESSSR
jgi:acyl carrier protein